MDYRNGMARDVSAWPITSYGWAPADMKYRWDWITPLAISPHDHNRVYVGAQVVFMTDQRRPELEGDQSRPDDEHQVAPGELRRHHVGQPDDVRRRHALLHRRVAGEGRRDLDRERRRAGERHPGRRRATGRTSRRTSPTCRRGARSGASRHRASTRARRTSSRTCSTWGTTTRWSTRRLTMAQSWKLISSGVPKGVNSQRAHHRRGSGAQGHALPRHRQRAVRHVG